MNRAFVIIEYDDKVVDDSALELAALARTLVGDQGSVDALLAGSGVEAAAQALKASFNRIHVWDDARLAVPDGELLGSLFGSCVDRESPDVVLAAHTNTAMDFIPGLAVHLDRPLITDCLAVEWRAGVLHAVRPAYGGKLHARVAAAESARGYVVTVRPGAIKADSSQSVDGTVVQESFPAALEVRRRNIRTVSIDASDVDISQAERLVAVGRGIQDEEGLAMIRSLADALGAEVACSRPVVDKQWMPKSRQVGTSGKSVKPKLYLAVGISGSFQHMGGIKGEPFLVAINKDPRAPIFSVADVGIVGDLFDVVPVLEERIRALKA